MSDNLPGAIQLILGAQEAVLSTIEGDRSFVSAVNYSYLPDQKFGKMYLLMSELARHTKNVRKNPQVSLLVMESGPLPVYERKRVTVQGELSEVHDPKLLQVLKEDYLKRFQKSQIFFTLPDFHFFEVGILELYFIEGFGKIQSFK